MARLIEEYREYYNTLDYANEFAEAAFEKRSFGVDFAHLASEGVHRKCYLYIAMSEWMKY